MGLRQNFHRYKIWIGGFNRSRLSSFDFVPIEVGYDWIEISEP
jgi:hypothetical protein